MKIVLAKSAALACADLAGGTEASGFDKLTG